MKSLLLAIILFLAAMSPVLAQTASPSASPVLGLYDEELNSTTSASVSATPRPSPTATASARTTTYLDPTKAPVSGSVENTVIIFSLGVIFIIAGVQVFQNYNA